MALLSGAGSATGSSSGRAIIEFKLALPRSRRAYRTSSAGACRAQSTAGPGPGRRPTTPTEAPVQDGPAHNALGRLPPRTLPAPEHLGTGLRRQSFTYLADSGMKRMSGAMEMQIMTFDCLNHLTQPQAFPDSDLFSDQKATTDQPCLANGLDYPLCGPMAAHRNRIFDIQVQNSWCLGHTNTLHVSA